jgi:cytochrome c biogenesis protein CcdA/thiol-disulfide isomerase/thioredoxin
MTLLILAYVGGVLTILSPCILPMLPFVLARADQPFLKSGLPMLLGMAMAFTAVASLAAVGGGWAVQANEYGRLAALALLVIFAVTLLSPALAERLTRPLVALGSQIAFSADGSALKGRRFVSSLGLGMATGLLWAPCAGPVLGLILTGAAIQGANVGTSLLLLAYAGGAATSLALSLLVGGRVHAALRHSLGISQWARRGLGLAVLGSVMLIATGLDTGLLSQLSISGTTKVEQKLLDYFTSADRRPAPAFSISNARLVAAKFDPDSGRELPHEGVMAPLAGAVVWINSPELKSEDLRGKVVLVDFWTYSCINCLRTLPFVRAWADKYKDAGLVVVGVHSPEFAFEKNPGHVRKAVKELNITYPVAIDSQHAIWRAFGNRYWPALYFVDARGQVRHHIFGEGQYDKAERVIQQLLAENGKTGLAGGLVTAQGQGTQAAPGSGSTLSRETYLGHAQADGFVPAGGMQPDRPHHYRAADTLKLNEWTLDGLWTVERERAVAGQAGGRLATRFSARDLHLVLGREAGAQPVRFRILVDGKPPMTGHGTDVNARGEGVVDAHQLYQLVRLPSSAGEHVFEIKFLDPGAHAYAFTFG